MYTFLRRAPPLNFANTFRCRYTTPPPTDPSAWKFDGSLMYYESPDVINSPKIACFGWNKCLVTTSLYIRGDEAWKLRYVNVPDKLKELHDKGYKLVVFCNQSYIGQATTDEVRNRAILNQTNRMGKFLDVIGLPFQMMVATAKTPRRKGAEIEDPYRKPNPGMWKYLIENLNGGVAPDMNSCFYVGGAAGRPKEGARRADHNDYDLGFAENAKLTFHTDDSFFGLDKKEKGPSTGKKQKDESEEKPKKRKAKKKEEDDEMEDEDEDENDLEEIDEDEIDEAPKPKKKKAKGKKKKESNEMADEDEDEYDEFGDVKSKKKSKSKRKSDDESESHSGESKSKKKGKKKSYEEEQ